MMELAELRGVMLLGQRQVAQRREVLDRPVDSLVQRAELRYRLEREDLTDHRGRIEDRPLPWAQVVDSRGEQGVDGRRHLPFPAISECPQALAELQCALLVQHRDELLCEERV